MRPPSTGLNHHRLLLASCITFPQSDHMSAGQVGVPLQSACDGVRKKGFLLTIAPLFVDSHHFHRYYHRKEATFCKSITEGL